MGNKYKILLVITCFLFLGIVGFSNKVEAGGCYTAFSYGPYPGSLCNRWSPWSAFIHSCQENNSYSDCYNWYYNGHYCYGDWYDISCDSSNCGDTVTCPVCGNTVTCPNCGTPTPTGEVKDCGESGCNDAPYPYCTSGNRCDGNVCNRISCPDGYKKSGYCDCVPDVTPTPTFTPTPLPLNCGQSGCDGRGCTPSNISCNSNVCQVNCPAGHTLIDNCNCLPPCSNLSASFSQNSCSLNISISGASSYLRNLAFSGPPVSTITQNILYRHTITSAGTKAWTLTWQEVASVGSATPRNCSTTISNTIDPPGCGTANVATVPAPPIWGSDVRLNAVILPPADTTYSLLGSSHPLLTPCSGNAFTVPPDGETCLVPWINMSPKVYPWTITWQTISNACPAVTNSSCIYPASLTAVNRPSYLKTNNGVSYIKTINNQPYFNPADSFSTNTFGSLNNSANAHTLPCTGNAVNCTLRNYLLISYTDKNSSSSWYAYFKNPLENNPKVNLVNWTGIASLSNVMASSLLSSTKENVIEITGNFDASGLCTRANIFLVSGDLNITPDLTISGANDACLFIVNGTTRMLSSSKVAVTCGGATNPTTVANPQDKVQAFIITNNFTTNTSEIQLYVKGGVITNTFIGGLNRKVNTDSCIYPNLPSELMDYEGARYIKNLKDALGEATTISIFENQYKSTR